MCLNRQDYSLSVDNPSGGQFSSLSDLALLAKSILNPRSKPSILSPMTTSEWLKPVVNLFDGVTSVGIPWEITRTTLPYGRTTEEYSKGQY